MKTHQVQQKTERRISAALRLVIVAALLLGQIALAFFLRTELRQRAAIIYTVLELTAENRSLEEVFLALTGETADVPEEPETEPKGE